MLPKKALVADDAATQRLYLQLELSNIGFDVTAVADGDAALDMARSEQFDLIVLDVVMPTMDGFSICRLLKSDLNTKNTPVILISSTDNQTYRIKSQLVGAQAYIPTTEMKLDFLNQVNSLTSRALTSDLTEQTVLQCA